MRTVIVGAGRAGKAVMELVASGLLAELRLDIVAVVEADVGAPGLPVARSHGWPIFTDSPAALALPGVELVVELTGDDRVLAQLHRQVGSGVRVMDHAMARVFWDLHGATSRLREQLAAQRDLQQQQARAARRFAQLLTASQSIIAIKSRDGRFQEVNPMAASLFGSRAEELVGKTAREALPAGAAQIIEEHDRDAWNAGYPICHREKLPLGDGVRVLHTERFLLDGYAHGTGDPGNADSGSALCCVAQDMTEQLHMQQQLVLTEKQAAVGRLAAGVAHEINNPLTGVLTFAESLREELAGDATAQDDLAVIIRETLRCRQIVRTLLDFSRPASAARGLTAIATVVRNSVELVAKQASFQDMRFHLDLGDEGLRVHADANQLQQAILNLLINARDASDGRGEIRVRAGRADEGRSIFVEVQDDGCGIDAQLQERIFEPFFSTKADRGHGLGLAVIRNIIEQHGGRIAVQSRPGAGATFRILLPAASATIPSPTTPSAGGMQ